MLKFSQNLGCAQVFSQGISHIFNSIFIQLWSCASTFTFLWPLSNSSSGLFIFLFHLLFLISSLYFKEALMPCLEHSPCNLEALSSNPTLTAVASHAGVFRGACFSSLPTNACSTEDKIPFPSLANHTVLTKFWEVDLYRRVKGKLSGKAFCSLINVRFRAAKVRFSQILEYCFIYCITFAKERKEGKR